MKAIYKNTDELIDCPECQCQLVSFNGDEQICPSCAAKKIKQLMVERLKLKRRIEKLKRLD